jgi:hypothetical protein
MGTYTNRIIQIRVTGLADLGSKAFMWSQRNQVYEVTCGLCHGMREEIYKLVK